MAREFIRKFFMGMMTLVIIFIVEQKAIDLTFASFNPTSVPIPLPYHLKLDNVTELLADCIDKEIEDCRHKEIVHHFVKTGLCILQSFESCMKNPLHQGTLDYKMGMHEKSIYKQYLIIFPRSKSL